MVADGLSAALSKYAWPNHPGSQTELFQIDRRIADFTEKLEQLLPKGKKPELGTTDPRAVTTLAKALEGLLADAERYFATLQRTSIPDGSYDDQARETLLSSRRAVATLLSKVEHHTGPSQNAELIFAVEGAKAVSLAHVWEALAKIPEIAPTRLHELRLAVEFVAGTEGTLTIEGAQRWASALSSPDAQAHVLARIGRPDAALPEVQELGASLVVSLIRLMNARQI
jgi:hypothetical protein